MTVRAQDDHLIAGAWAACGEIRNLVHIKCESFIVLCSYMIFIFSETTLFEVKELFVSWMEPHLV